MFGHLHQAGFGPRLLSGKPRTFGHLHRDGTGHHHPGGHGLQMKLLHHHSFPLLIMFLFQLPPVLTPQQKLLSQLRLLQSLKRPTRQSGGKRTNGPTFQQLPLQSPPSKKPPSGTLQKPLSKLEMDWTLQQQFMSRTSPLPHAKHTGPTLTESVSSQRKKKGCPIPPLFGSRLNPFITAL